MSDNVDSPVDPGASPPDQSRSPPASDRPVSSQPEPAATPESLSGVLAEPADTPEPAALTEHPPVSRPDGIVQAQATPQAEAIPEQPIKGQPEAGLVGPRAKARPSGCRVVAVGGVLLIVLLVSAAAVGLGYAVYPWKSAAPW